MLADAAKDIQAAASALLTSRPRWHILSPRKSQNRNFQREERGVSNEIRLQSASALAKHGLLQISLITVTSKVDGGMSSETKRESRATNPLLPSVNPVIPAKAGIQRPTKPAARNQVRIADDKSLPPLWGKARMGGDARKRGFGVPEFKRKPSPLIGEARMGAARASAALRARRPRSQDKRNRRNIKP